jgi:hypothetical protein
MMALVNGCVVFVKQELGDGAVKSLLIMRLRKYLEVNNKYMNKIEIEEVDNGWVLSYWTDYEDTGLPHQNKIAFSYNDEGVNGEMSKLKALEMLLWEVNEKVGVLYSKHNKNNINIEIV